MNRIRMNDWDVVIMSHSQFSKIPQNPDINIEIIEKELDNLEENLMEAKSRDISKKDLRNLEIARKNLRAKLNLLIERKKELSDTGVLNFDQLGIDHIIVDESHIFKNLTFQSRHARVAGIGNTEGSNIAMDLLTALRTIQRKKSSGEGGATFYSWDTLTKYYKVQAFLIYLLK